MRKLLTTLFSLSVVLYGSVALAQETTDATKTTDTQENTAADAPKSDTETKPQAPPAAPPPPKAPTPKPQEKNDAEALSKKNDEALAKAEGHHHRETPAAQDKPLAALPEAASPESNFVDTRISFIFGDDDFLHKAGETIVDSPLPGFGNRNGYELFFDNLNSSRTGRENQLHLVLYKKLAGYIPGLTTEGAIVTKYDFSTERDGDLKDDGTYLLITYKNTTGPKFSVTMFPVSTNRFRLGYLYDLTWAGSDAFPGAYRKLTPGIKFALTEKTWYTFLGFKTSRMLTNPPPGSSGGREMETFYAALAGFGIKPDGSTGFSIEANGGFVQMGQNPNNGVEGETVQLFGGSMRLAYMSGMRMGMSADLRLFRNDAKFVKSLVRRPKYNPGFHYLISAEGNFITQSLQDPDAYGTTTLQNAYAGALNFKFQKDFLRGNFTVFSRSTSFILMNVPSYVPYQAFSEGLDTNPELFAAAGLDYFFKDINLTVGITAGLQLPAAAQVDLTATTGASDVDLGVRTVVIRDMGQLSILPEGKEREVIFGTKLSAKLQLSDMMAITLMVLYQRDPNYTTLKTLANGTSSREFESPNKFGAAIVTSAKF